MLHSFLLAGQSNMAGRGFLKEVPMICNERIKVQRNGKWQIMMEPINYDRPFAGVGPSASFAAAWCRKNKDQEIGLIPCAEGGSSLDDWSVDGPLFEHAILQAKLAKTSSKLEGILWHQGENECSSGLSKRYHEKFSKIVEAFRRELNEPELPIIIGGIGSYLSSGFLGQYFPEHSEVNEALLEFAEKEKNCYFATASGLTPNPDGIHLNAVSQRIFGFRYFEAYVKRNHVLEPLEGEENAVTIFSERPLTKTEKSAILDKQFAGGEISIEEYQLQLELNQ
ncbi:sialate O-acetylesterase [Jeotgalibacillus sp. S-D1]|uniref:sialate O-acetylesterase n=1 Tax=Jeotgalibacillus sp. S-D1 TaxID=2552189 RepID=UPI00105A6482|nr:sialate O-acetylesterase [Jeotgalibacillus sp. S-D1]TDL31179.1 sialate O-acetylesterase [Jeotgalibacillus sp. S-D1]